MKTFSKIILISSIFFFSFSVKAEEKLTLPSPFLNVFIIFKKSSKRYAESCGPGDDSGWYCTEKAGTFLQRIPSRVPSFKFTWVSSTCFWSSASRSTQKPWFCEVISILSVLRFFTGWFPPRWPNFNL